MWDHLTLRLWTRRFEANGVGLEEISFAWLHQSLESRLRDFLEVITNETIQTEFHAERRGKTMSP